MQSRCDARGPAGTSPAPVPLGSPAGGATRRDGRPTDVLRAVDGADAYANLVLPAAAARAPDQPGGTRRSPPSSPTARCACAARTTRSSPPAPTGRSARSTPPVLDVLRLGAHQLLAHAGARARRGVRDGRPGAGGARRGPRPVSSTPCCARVRSHDLEEWLAERRARRRRRRRTSTWRWSPRTRCGSCARCARRCARAGATRRAARACSPRTTRARGSPSSRGPASSTPRSCVAARRRSPVGVADRPPG